MTHSIHIGWQTRQWMIMMHFSFPYPFHSHFILSLVHSLSRTKKILKFIPPSIYEKHLLKWCVYKGKSILAHILLIFYINKFGYMGFNKGKLTKWPKGGERVQLWPVLLSKSNNDPSQFHRYDEIHRQIRSRHVVWKQAPQHFSKRKLIVPSTFDKHRTFRRK